VAGVGRDVAADESGGGSVYFSVPRMIHGTPHGLMESMDYHVDSMDL